MTKAFINGVLREMTPEEEAEQASLQQTIQADIAAQEPGGEITQPRSTDYWNGWYGDGSTPSRALVNRIGGRLLIGAAVDNDATWYEGGTERAPQGFSDWDWLGDMSRHPINGGMGVGLPFQNDVNYSQVAILADDIAGTKRAGPLIALTAGVRSLNSKDYSTPRALNFYGIKNNRELLQVAGNPLPCGEFDGSEFVVAASGHQFVSVWGAYGEGQRLVPGPGNVYTVELESRNAVDLVTWQPYSTPGAGTVTLTFGAGCGLDPKGQFPPTAAIVFAPNPINFAAGIIFLGGSIGPYGIGGSYPAIMLAVDYELQWFFGPNALAGSIKANAAGLHLQAGAMRLTLRPDGMSIMVGTEMRGVFVDPQGFLKVG